MQRLSLEERYLTAWQTIAPAAEAPRIVVKKWPRGTVHQITMPGVHPLTLRSDEFVQCLQASEALAAIFAKYKPVELGPDNQPLRRPGAL